MPFPVLHAIVITGIPNGTAENFLWSIPGAIRKDRKMFLKRRSGGRWKLPSRKRILFYSWWTRWKELLRSTKLLPISSVKAKRNIFSLPIKSTQAIKLLRLLNFTSWDLAIHGRFRLSMGPVQVNCLTNWGRILILKKRKKKLPLKKSRLSVARMQENLP